MLARAARVTDLNNMFDKVIQVIGRRNIMSLARKDTNYQEEHQSTFIANTSHATKSPAQSSLRRYVDQTAHLRSQTFRGVK